MIKIDINKIEDIKEKLNDLKEDETLCITENGHEKYIVMDVNEYDALINDTPSIFSDDNIFKNPNVKIISPDNFEMTYDEYESIKKQVIDAFERTFKPKPEKLN